MMQDNIFHTATMAKVYADQGNLKKAADIYRYILDREPKRQDIRKSLSEIEIKLYKKKKIKDLVPLFGRWVDLIFKYNKLQRLKKLQAGFKEK